jgi:uncharacterized repeat protein (TIGR01451 family)
MKLRKTVVRILAAVALAVSVAATAAPVAQANAQSADLATTIVSPSTTSVGSYLYYTITATNNGPDSASNVVISDATPSNMWAAQPTTFYCVGSGTAWCGKLKPSVSCTTPNVGSTGTVSCTTASLSAGASMTITMVVHVGFYMHNQLVVDTAKAASNTFDPNTANNTATVSARVS